MRTAPRRRPSLEVLEDRNLLAVFGLPWPDPQHLTVSFAPDGTSVGGTPSTLFRTLNAAMPTAQWQSDVLAGLQSWADLGNINVGVVTDDGRALGAPGPVQGVPGVGDIRIAARPLAHNEIAIGAPYDTFGGWAGTIIFNSDATFGDTASALENFLSVAVHESGHVFGFADQHTDPTSIMYDVDTGALTSPSAADAAALRSLYGARQGDATEGASGNETSATAGPLPFNAPSAISADITTLTDKDVFSFTTPWNYVGPVSIDVRSAGLSLLTPKVTVSTALGLVATSYFSTDPLNNNVMVTLPVSVPGTTYYVQVQSGQSNVFGIGAYRLAVGTASQALAAVMAPNPLTFGSTSGHGNTAIGSSTYLLPSTSGTDARWPYAITAGLTGPSDADYYRVQTGSIAPGATILTVSNLQASTVTPVVSVFDANHHPLSVQVLNSGPSGETVQVVGVPANSSLYIEVSEVSSSNVGDSYFLGVTYRSTPVGNPTLASGTMTASNPLDFRTLTVNSTRLFHFDLSSTIAAGAPPSAVLMTIFDASENAVFNLRAIAGAGSSVGDVMLNPGTYIVRLIAATKTGVPLPQFNYILGGQLRDEPDGPNPSDPIFQPVGSSPNGPSQDPGTWTQQGSSTYQNALQPQNTYGDPWS